MKLPRLQIVKLHQAIAGMMQAPNLDKRLIYAMTRTKAKIVDVFDAVVAMEKMSEEMTKFDNERTEAAMRFAKRKENGEVESVGKYIQLADETAYNAALALLRVKYKDAVETYEANQKVVAEHLKGEDEVSLHAAPFEWLPDQMNPQLQADLEPMITHPEEAVADAKKA